MQKYFTSSTKKQIKNPDFQMVAKFYSDMCKDPVCRPKLEMLKIKKNSDSHMPEQNDILIISEAIELLKNDNLCLISGDGHFTEFKEEISHRFGLPILDFYDLNIMTRS